MNEMTLTPSARPNWRTFINAHVVSIFATLTVVLSVAVILLPLPMYAGPALVVFFPTLIAALLIRLTEGKGQIRSQLFSKQAWWTSLKWIAISLGLGIGIRMAVTLLGMALVPGYKFQSGPLTPLLLIVFVFAAGEEIGWRGFALPRLLKSGASPLKAAILLGIPWALMHQSLLLPGKLSEGVPPLAQFLTMLSLSIITTWLYLAPKGKILSPTLLHGGQNAASIVGSELPLALYNWLFTLVFVTIASLVIVFTRGRLGQSERTE